MTSVDENTDLENALRVLTIEQLVARLRGESAEEGSRYYEELIRRFEPLLRRTWRRLVSVVEYQDFLQDVILRLFAGLPRLKNPKAFPGYFRRIVLSVAADLYRRHSRTPLGDEDSLKEIASQLDEEFLGGLFVRSYFEELPPRERQVLTLEFIQGLSTGEIAAKTGLSDGAVRTVKSRALNRLRSILLREADALAKKRTE